MTDQDKNKEELIREVAALRKRVAELEANQAAGSEPRLTLQDPHGLFEKLAENAPVGIFIVQGTGFVYINPALAAMAGRVPDDFRDRNFWEAVHPDDREMIKDRGLARLAGKDVPGTYQVRFLSSGARTRYAETHVTTIDFEGQPATLGIVQDVTDQRAAELELAQSRETYRSLIENSEDSIFTLNDEGVFLFMNEVAARTLGGDPDSLTGKTQWDIFPKEVADRQMASVRGVFKSGKAEWFERKTHFGSREYIFFTSLLPIRDSSGRVESVMGVSRDVSELLETREALHESREKYIRLVDNLPVGVFQTDTDGMVVTGNPALAVMYGCDSIEEYLALPARESFVNPEERDEMMRIATEEGQVRDYEVQMKRKDGSYFWISLSGRAVMDQNGGPVRFDGIEIDITKRKQAEEALRKTGDTLRALLNAPNNPLFLIDTDGYLLALNDNLAEALGQKVEDLIGTKIHQYMPEQLARSRRDYELKVIETGKPLRYEDSDGTRYFSNRLYPVVDFEGKVEAIAISSINVTDRTEAENALRSSEELFRTLAETSPVGVMIYQGDKAVYANRALCKMVDLEPEDFGKVDFWAYAHPDYVDIVKERGMARQRGEEVPDSYELKFIGRGDKERWGLIQGSPMEYRGQPASMVLVVDITERKEMEQALITSEEKYRNLFENSQVGMFRSSLDGKQTLAVNQGVADIWGYSVEELLSMPALRGWYDPKDRDAFRESLQRDGSVRDFEASIRDAQGQKKEVLISARLFPNLGYLEGSVVDISERKEIEQALEDSERMFRTLAEAAPVGIYIYQDGQVVYANHNAYHIAGLETTDDSPETLMSYVHPDDKGLIEASADLILRGEETSDTLEFRVISTSGETKWVILKAEATLYKGRRAAMGVAMDITDRKRAEEALRTSQARLSSIFDATDDFILLCDENASPIYYNTAYAQVMKELLGVEMKPGFQPHTLLPDPEERALWEGYHRRVLSGESFKIEHSQQLADGRARYFVSSFYPVTSESGIVTGFTEFTNEVTDRIRAQEALQASEERYREILDGVHEGIGFLDGDQIVRFANPAFAHIFGQSSPEEIVGRNLTDFVTEDGARLILEETDKRRDGHSSQYELEITVGNATKLLFVSASPRFTASGQFTGTFGTVLDISDRKLAQEALRETEEKFRGIFDESVAAIYLFDANKRFIDSNQAGLDLLGYTRNELLSLSIPDVDLDTTETLPAHNQLLTGGRIVNYEHSLVRKDGRVITVLNNSLPLTDADGAVIGMQSTLIDITDRKRAAEALRESEQFNRAVIENSPLGISVRSRYGRLLSVNQTWRDFWQIPDEVIREYMAADPKELKLDSRDKYLGKWAPKVEKVYREGGVLHVPEIYVADHRSGEIKWVSHTFYAILDDKGLVSRVVILTSDITERKRAENALRESEERLRTTVESMNDMLFLLDDKGVFVQYYQPANSNDLYAPPDEFLGKSVEDVLPPNVAGRTISAIERLKKDATPERFDYSLEIRGSLRWYSNVLSRRLDATGSFVGVTGVVRDITDRVEAEQALRASEASLLSILENTHDLIMLTDRRGRIVYMNSAFAKSVKELIGEEIEPGMILNERMPEDSRPAWNEMYARALSGERFRVDFSWVAVNGETRHFETWFNPVRAEGEVQGFSQFTHEVTQNKRAEAALRESEEKFRLTADQSFDAIFLQDRDGKIIYVSNSIARVMGYDPSDLIGRLPTDIVDPASRPIVEQTLENLSQGKPAGPIEIKGISPGGSLRNLEVTAAPILKDGEITGSQAIVRDITARKRAERLLARAYDAQSTQLRQVAGGLAHDVYNDLFPVTASLHKLRQRTKASDHPDRERNLKLIGLMDSAVQRAIALTESVNLYSKLDRVAIEEGMDLQEVIDTMLEQNRDRIEALDVEVTVDIPDRLRLKCPEPQGFYLFNNLLINALDALAHVENRQLSIKAKLTEGQTRVMFSDTGPGIPPDILNRVFDPFFSTKPRTGTGLGLAIAKRIVDLCRGDIAVESSLDKGTTFTILITGDVGTSQTP